ncbi:amidohydrolase family protein [Prosthecobacter fluviatilis]|uniref:Amidohydrolase family protein n=1 Tax=Prosthecobacter fluviatilis TaxID=445931 RepID=A0ABW0KS83_9BACT
MNRRHFLSATLAGSAAVAAAAPPKGIIDCQSHLFFPEVLDMMRKRKTEPLVHDDKGTVFLKMGDWLRKVPPFYLDVDAKLATMDASGIEITMLSTNDPGPEWFGADGAAVAQLIHDSLAAVIAKHPTRFRGLCVLPLQNEKAAAEELDRCVNKLGFKGILLYTNLAGAWCDEPQFHWLYARAEELGVPILLHPAKPMTTEQVKGYELTSTLGNMFVNTIAIARIIASGLLDKHPKLKLVCPHLGGTLPYISGRMDHQLTVLKRGPQNLQRKPSEYLRSIYMDIVSPLPEAMRFALDFSSADRLLFSSDHPWVEPKEILEPLRSLKLSADEEQKILSGNARQLFGLT